MGEPTVLDKLGGRKFVLTVAVIAVGCVIDLATERGVSEGLVALLIGTLAAFNATNAAVTWKAMSVEQRSQQSSEPAAPAAPVTVDTSELQAQVSNLQVEAADLHAKLDQIATGVQLTNQVLAQALQPRPPR